MGRVQHGNWLSHQVGEQADGSFAAGRAFVNGFSIGYCFGIRCAAGKSALPALGLRQQTVDLLNQVQLRAV
jgi:hypothetical protein